MIYFQIVSPPATYFSLPDLGLAYCSLSKAADYVNGYIHDHLFAIDRIGTLFYSIHIRLKRNRFHLTWAKRVR